MRLRKSYKDGVNSLSAAQRRRTLPARATTQAPGSLGCSVTHGGRPPLGPIQRQCPRRSGRLLGQLLGHQEAAQVTRARVAWPLRLGWKKSRVLTWLALNW
jgi:hypothetical protein